MIQILFSVFVLFISTNVQASPWDASDGETQELTYDDLVQELSKKKTQIESKTVAIDPFESVKIHAGIGSVSGVSTFVLNHKTTNRYQNGMCVSAGVDLFSPSWFSEVSWKNFGETHSGAETHYLRELDLKIGHKRALGGPWSFRLESGLAQRHLRLRNDTNQLNIDEMMPGLLGIAGFSAQFNSTVSLNVDLSARTPVISGTVDRGSVDMGLELKISL